MRWSRPPASKEFYEPVFDHKARYAPPVEFVERKGAGHPDTICDNLADKLAQRLAREYVGHTGAVQAFNVDKAILAAGTAEVEFGGGRHITPARLILVGKADMSHGWEPDRDALVKATETELAEILPDAVPDAYEVDIWLGQSSADLAVVLSGRGAQVPLSNDTSFAAVSLPPVTVGTSGPRRRAQHQLCRLPRDGPGWP